MRATVLIIFLGCSVMSATAATTYDPVQDFSTVNNPSGVWSYGYKSSPNDVLTLYPTNYGGSWGIYSYTNGSPAPGTYLFGAAKFALISSTGKPTLSIAWRPSLFPPPPAGPEEPTLRFTSPGSGNCTIQIYGYVEYGDVDLSMTVNNEIVSTQTVFQTAGLPDQQMFKLRPIHHQSRMSDAKGFPQRSIPPAAV